MIFKEFKCVNAVFLKNNYNRNNSITLVCIHTKDYFQM